MIEITERYNLFLKIFQNLNKNGCVVSDVKIASDSGQIVSFKADGFCKSGTAQFDYGAAIDQEITATTRYNTLDSIFDYSDVVSLAWGWYQRSKPLGYFTEPPAQFVNDFVNHGYLKAEIVPEHVVYKEA